MKNVQYFRSENKNNDRAIKLIVFFALFLSFSLQIEARIVLTDRIYCTGEDRKIYHNYISEFRHKKSLPVDQLIVQTAMFFLGKPYVSATLEKEPEGLVVNLREFDCTTLVETVFALSYTLKDDDLSFENFCRNLQYIRYREGVANNYMDRLHYTSDWLYINDKKGVVKDINREIGGKPLILNLHFMSTHPDSYRQLKGNSDFVRKISLNEKEINSRRYYYISENDIDSFADKMKSGDMVCFTTDIKGLDISHVGFIYKEKEKLTFIHASSLAKKVIINEASLKEYVLKGKNNTGIMLARPVN